MSEIKSDYRNDIINDIAFKLNTYAINSCRFCAYTYNDIDCCTRSCQSGIVKMLKENIKKEI